MIHYTSKFEAKLAGNTITITVGENDQTITLTATINRPAGVPADKAIPALINPGSLPGQVFSSRGIATIAFNIGQVAPTAFSGITYDSGNFMKLYPKATAGFMVRWA